MSDGVFVMPLTRFLAAGNLNDDFAFDDFACSLNEEVEQFLKRKAAQLVVGSYPRRIDA